MKIEMLSANDFKFQCSTCEKNSKVCVTIGYECEHFCLSCYRNFYSDCDEMLTKLNQAEWQRIHK